MQITDGDMFFNKIYLAAKPKAKIRPKNLTKMTGVLFLALFYEVNWSLCKHTYTSAGLHIDIAFDGTAAGLWLLAVSAAKSWLPGCD